MGIQPQRLAEVMQRAFDVPLLHQGPAEIRVRVRIVGVVLQRGFDRLGRQVLAAELHLRLCSQVDAGDVFRVERQSEFGGFERLLPAFLLEPQTGQQRVVVGVERIECDRHPDGIGRFVQPVALVEHDRSRVVRIRLIGAELRRRFGRLFGFVVLLLLDETDRQQPQSGGIVRFVRQDLSKLLVGDVKTRLADEHLRTLQVWIHGSFMYLMTSS